MSDFQMPAADEIFQVIGVNNVEFDEDEIVFDDAGSLDNPLSSPLVAALRLVKRLHARIDSYRTALKQAIEQLRELHLENQSLKRRNRELLEQVRR